MTVEFESSRQIVMFLLCYRKQLKGSKIQFNTNGDVCH